MHYRNRWTMLGLLGALAFGVACDDTTGPNEEFSADAAAEDYEAMNEVTNSEEWEDFRTSSSHFEYGDGESADVPAALAQTLESLGSLRGGDGEAVARALVENFGDLPTSNQAIISEVHLGVTFEWSVEIGRYVPSLLDGAPSNGVRFVLYDLDEEDEPIVESEIGYVDLIDEGADVSPIILRLSATANGVNFVDYRVEWDNPEAGSGGLAIDGFLRNETDQLDFSITVANSQSQSSESIDITFDASMDSRDFEIGMELSGVDGSSGNSAGLTLSVEHGPHSVVVSGTVTEEVLDGTISLNGELWATMTGDPDNPDFNSADGDGFTAEELNMLGEIGAMAERVFAFFGELVEPAMHIIFLGLIL